MSIPIKTKVIDGHTYSVTALPGRRGLEMSGVLLKLLGPPLFEALAAGFRSLDDDHSKLVPAVMRLCMTLDPKQLPGICDELLYAGLEDKVPLGDGRVDVLFQGRTFALYQVLAFAIEVNFSDFLPGLAALMPAAKADQTSPNSPT